MTEPLYPAIFAVHWPGKDVNCCIRHAEELTKVAEAMGFDVSTTVAPPDAQCTNCVNEGER